MNEACIINELAVLGHTYQNNLELCFNTEWIDRRWHENRDTVWRKEIFECQLDKKYWDFRQANASKTRNMHQHTIYNQEKIFKNNKNNALFNTEIIDSGADTTGLGGNASWIVEHMTGRTVGLAMDPADKGKYHPTRIE
jgi:hypothetical protein